MQDACHVRAIVQNNKYADITYLSKKPTPKIRKISKNQYVNIDTGEIGDYDLKENKVNIESIRKTFKQLVCLIRHNFTADSENQLFITLTYIENMKSRDKLYSDFKKFFQKLKRKYTDIKLDYILVAEPQGRGAWHVHMMLKGDKPLFIPHKVIKDLWGFGRTETVRLKSDDVGRYYVAYFTNLEVESKEENSQEKKYIKGARLPLYPSGMKIYRTTRGIEKPPKVVMTWGELKEQFGEPTWKQQYEILGQENGNEKIINMLYKASFKKQD